MEHPRMLLVDDDESVLFATQMAFEENDFDVQSLRTSEEAINTVTGAPHAIDILVTDRDLAGIDCEKLVEVAHNLGVYTVIFTANDLTKDGYCGAPVIIKPRFKEVLEVWKTRNDTAA